MSTTRPSGTQGSGLGDPYGGGETIRRGAHRARPTPLMAALPAAAVVLVVLLVAFGVYTLLGGAGSPGDKEGYDTTGGGASPSASTSPSPSASAEQSPEDQPSEAAAEPDKTVHIKVLNNTGTPKLAAKGKTKLEGAGWNVVGVGDHKPRGSVPVTTVYYANEDQKATAEAIAADLGVGGVEQNPDLAGDGITVVLATDFTP